MLSFRSFFFLCMLGLLAAGCANSAVRAESGVEAQTTASPESFVPEGCPATKPPDARFVPPRPWPATPPGPGQYWFGGPGLWTALPEDGSWRQLALGEKFWWWSEAYSRPDDPTPDLLLTAERLDGKAAPFRTADATNGYHESFHQAMLVGVELPSPGCWKFTAEFKDDTLSFVVWVPEK